MEGPKRLFACVLKSQLNDAEGDGRRQSKERNHVDCILMAADVDRRISRICAGSTAPALKQSEQDITS